MRWQTVTTGCLPIKARGGPEEIREATGSQSKRPTDVSPDTRTRAPELSGIWFKDHGLDNLVNFCAIWFTVTHAGQVIFAIFLAWRDPRF